MALTEGGRCAVVRGRAADDGARAAVDAGRGRGLQRAGAGASAVHSSGQGRHRQAVLLPPPRP
eukprot:1367431-Rhodomonas_salina.1